MNLFAEEDGRIAEASVICPESTEVFGSHVGDAVAGE